MFSNAKLLNTTSKSKKVEAATVHIDGLETLASLDAVIKALSALKDTVESEVKSRGEIEFIQRGMEKKSRPDNFKAFDGIASASVQLKKRSSASALSDAEVALLSEVGISVETNQEIVSTFVINPAYKDDQKLLSNVEKKLKGVKGIPEDFILMQEGKSKTVVPDGALDEVFKLDEDKVRALLPVVSTLAIRPSLADGDVTKAYDIIKDLLGV
jgi:hypothetical protein